MTTRFKIYEIETTTTFNRGLRDERIVQGESRFTVCQVGKPICHEDDVVRLHKMTTDQIHGLFNDGLLDGHQLIGAFLVSNIAA